LLLWGQTEGNPSFTPLFSFGYGVDRLLIRFTFKIKIRFFNQVLRRGGHSNNPPQQQACHVSGYIMRLFVTAILLLTFGQILGQKKQCHCDKDTLMNDATVSCETIKLKNNSKLYWQYNCDKIWLTLENKNSKKIVIDEVEVEFYGYAYRLGYHLIKEYESNLLFRSGCPATGPCTYVLVDKSNGKKVKVFDHLICIDTDSQFENAHPYEYDFIVYFTEKYDSLLVYFIDTKKKLKIPFDIEKNELTSAIPEHQFQKMSKEGNILTLTYENNKYKVNELKINLAPQKYSR